MTVICLSYVTAVIFYFIILGTAASACDGNVDDGGIFNNYDHGVYLAADMICEEHQVYFRDMSDGIYNLIVLQSTANFPDIMMPAYHRNRCVIMIIIAIVITVVTCS